MTLAIIDYGSGNLRSVAKAFEQVAPGIRITVTGDAKDLQNASHIVLPGVGAFADCMNGLKALPGMRDSLQEQIFHKKKSFLGICVGMQMLFEKGYEYGEHPGLGWLAGEVIALSSKDGALKIPHMGWNDLTLLHKHALTAGMQTGEHAYFVHSFYAQCRNDEDIVATTEYGQSIPAIVARENIMGTQFHPEKSQKTGLTLLKNFIQM